MAGSPKAVFDPESTRVIPRLSVRLSIDENNLFCANSVDGNHKVTKISMNLIE